jgi:hypothetical protein
MRIRADLPSQRPGAGRRKAACKLLSKCFCIASGLYYPAAMTFDTDGDELYVSNQGFGQAILFGRVAGS